MNNTYIKPEERKTILFISDDLRLYSGVGVMSKSIVYQTAEHFNWIQIGVSYRKENLLQPIDLSSTIDKDMGYTDSNVILYPDTIYADQYSNINSLRQIMKKHKIDAILFFTDPRYYIWIFENEREIRSQVPLIYYNIWDNLPYPLWNKPYYQSCDGLLAISKQTYNINIQLLENTIDDKIVRYIPHGIENSYFPMKGDENVLLEFKNKLFHGNNPNFTLLFNARNMSRKNISDLILAWQMFTEELSTPKAQKCVLVLHCNPIDYNGTDLIACYEDNCNTNITKIVFINENLDFKDMNLLYNISDGVILPSCAEGWGLSITEAMMTGKMFIATVTGGMQDQMRFIDENDKWIDFSKNFPTNSIGKYKNHGDWCIPIWPVTAHSIGSPKTPYIYEDYIKIEDIYLAIKELYNLPPKERIKRGMSGWNWANSEEAGFTASIMADKMVEGIESTIKSFVPSNDDKKIYKIKKNDKSLINRNIVWKPWKTE